MTVQGTANEPPASPEPQHGTQYIVGDAPTGAFASATAGSVARYDKYKQGWTFFKPMAGQMELLNAETGKILTWSGEAWATAAEVDGGDGLSKDNAEEYTPSEDYHPATKKYVDTKVIEATSADAVQYGLKFKQVGEDWFLARTVNGEDEQLLPIPAEMLQGGGGDIADSKQYGLKFKKVDDSWYLARTVDGEDEQLLLVPDEMTGGDTSGQITQAIEAHVSALHTWNGTATEALAPIYVSGTGNDETGDGTEAKPYRQISKAVSMVQPYNKTAATIYVDAGTYEEFTVDLGRDIGLVYTAEVVIAPTDATADAITVKRHSSLDISTTGASNSAGTYCNLRFNNCNRFINVENAQVTIGEKVFLTSQVTNKIYATLKSGAVRAAENAYFRFSGYTIGIPSHPAPIGKPIFHCDAARMVLKHVAGMSIYRKSNTSHIFTIFMLAENGGNIYLDGTYTTINAEVRLGLSADTGGTIAYSTITNNATIPTQTANGGRIFTGAE